jgi:hypothetical protein
MPKTVQDFQDGRQFSSVVEQLIRNEQVVGSSPTTGSIFTKKVVDILPPLPPLLAPHIKFFTSNQTWPSLKPDAPVLADEQPVEAEVFPESDRGRSLSMSQDALRPWRAAALFLSLLHLLPASEDFLACGLIFRGRDFIRHVTAEQGVQL